MKKVLSVILVIVMCFGLCGCSMEQSRGVSNGFGGVDIKVAATDQALENYFTRNLLYMVYDDYKFVITSHERNDNITGKNANGDEYQYYNVYGIVRFYNEYDELKREAKFKIVYASRDGAYFVADERTVVE